MLKIQNEERVEHMGYDVSYIENLKTNGGEFNLERYYLNAIDEETNEEFLDSSMGCFITLSETTATTDRDIIKGLYNVLFEEFGDSVTLEDEVVMVSAPQTLFSVCIENYVDEMTTANACEIIKNYLNRA